VTVTHARERGATAATAVPHDTQNPRVPKRAGCPNCSEDRMDWLVWLPDETVHCQTCGYQYDPQEMDR